MDNIAAEFSMQCQGDLVLLVGRSGAGKTRALNYHALQPLCSSVYNCHQMHPTARELDLSWIPERLRRLLGCRGPQTGERFGGLLTQVSLWYRLHEGAREHKVVLFDNISAGLHPHLMVPMAEELIAFAQKHQVQIIGTTHEQFFVDAVEAEDVVVCHNCGEGGQRAAYLSDHPEWDQWRGRYSTGEFWRTVGESWLEAL